MTEKELEAKFTKALKEFHSQELDSLKNEPNEIMRLYIMMEWMFKAGYHAREREEKLGG